LGGLIFQRKIFFKGIRKEGLKRRFYGNQANHGRDHIILVYLCPRRFDALDKALYEDFLWLVASNNTSSKLTEKNSNN